MSNGAHNMGGMHGFGRVDYDPNEPVFHEPWEGRIYAMMMCLGPYDVLGPDGLRAALESLEPSTYLGSTYYERWMKVIERALLAKGFLTKEELDVKTEHFRVHADELPIRRVDPALAQQTVDAVYDWNTPHQDTDIKPRFSPGDAVWVRNIHPKGHTRLPRYVRGKQGVVVRFYGVEDFHDVMPEGAAKGPQPVYNVRFEGTELWGDSAEANQALHIDMWESYLSPA